jgi:hypothetical protein
VDPTLNSLAQFAQMGGGQQPPDIGIPGMGRDMAGGQQPSAAIPGGLGAYMAQLFGEYDTRVRGLEELAMLEQDEEAATKLKQMANTIDRMKVDKKKKFDDAFSQVQAYSTGAAI